MHIAPFSSCFQGALRSALLMLVLSVLWAGSAHAVLITVTATGTAGSFKTGSVNAAGTKNDGDMVTINSGANRGWAAFDLSAIPAGSVINSVTANFTTFNTTLSGATNFLGGFIGDPATTAGATLYTLLNANATSNFSAATWAGNTTSTTLNSLIFNPAGLAFIGNGAGFSSVVISYVRGSTNTYNIVGYGGATGTLPELVIDYNPPVACSGAPTPGTTAATATAVCPTQAVTFSLPGIVPGTGNLTYQWQTSSNGTTFTNVAGATSNTYTATFSANAWVQCSVTCTNTSLSTISVPAVITANSFLNCYCASNATSTADEEILDVTVNGVSNASTCASVGPGPGSLQNKYSNYTSLTPVNCMIGGLIPFSVQIGTCGGNFGNSTKIYIDLNQNGSLTDPGENVYSSAGTTTGPHIEAGSFTLPIGSTPGVTLMRVITVETTPANINPCGTYTWGETEDYSINLVTPPVCTGATAGNTVATDSSVCATQSFTLSIPNAVLNSGLVYQWQASTDSLVWADITGANGLSYSTTQSDTTWYRCVVTCTAASIADTSDVLKIYQNSFMDCYCNSVPTSTADEEIFEVAINAVVNASTCASVGPGPGSIQNRYSNYKTLPPVSCFIGTSVPFSVQIGTCGGNFNNSVKIYIDYNQNGSFADAGENVYASPGTTNGPHTESGTFLIPVGTMPGITAMRVISSETTPANISPCGAITWGETEDYLVNLIQPVGCLGATAGNTASTDSSVCSTQTFTLSMPNTVINAGLVYQWQSSPDSAVWTDIAGATNIVYSTTQPDTTWYRCIVTCSQFSVSDTSDALKILMNSFLSCYCNSAATSTADEEILNVTLGGVSNSSTCASVGPGPGSIQNRYSNYTTLTPINCFTGMIIPFSVQIGTCGGNFNNSTKIYIDLNQNGSLADPGEEMYASPGTTNGPHTETGTIQIPLGTPAGLTLMRVINSETTPANINPCGTITWGETEDYLVNILPPLQFNGQMVAIYNPNTGCGLTSCEDLTFEVRNAGADSITSFNYTYSVNGGTPITTTQTLGAALQSGSTSLVVVPCALDLSTPGTYNIKVYIQVAGDTDPQLDTLVKTVTSIPTVTTFPYLEGFDNPSNPSGGWVSGGALNSWGLVTPAKSTINAPASAPNSWVTAPTGNYSNNEKSWVESPCLDFTSLVLPIIELSVWWDAEFSWDGMFVQSSTDGGTTWQNVGAMGTGQNWYNDNSVFGVNGFGSTQEAWSGTGGTGSGGWLTARHTMTGLGGQSGVRIRVGFGSDGSIVSGNGVAFDDILIYDTPANDMSTQVITAPNAGDCGDDSTAVMVVIKNTGTQPQAGFPVTATYNNGAGSQGVVTMTYPLTLAADSVDTVFVGTFNSLSGGLYNIAVYTDLVNDGMHLNDTTRVTVNINGVPASPLANDVFKCTPDSFLLSVTQPAAGMFYTWYDSISGGTQLDTGTSFMTPFISASTPYYVSVQGNATYQINTNVSGGSGASFGGFPSDGLEFTNTYPMTLDSVTIIPTGIGTIQLYVIEPSTGLIVDSSVVTTITTANVPTRIPVGIHIPNTGIYQLVATNSSTVPDLVYNWGGATFPYTAGGVSITGNTTGALFAYFFYKDWAITTLGCPSERTMVTAGIYAAPVVNLGPDYSACGGDTLSSGPGWTSTVWSYGSNVIASTPAVFADTSGTYSVVVTDGNGCVGTDDIIIQINPLPVVFAGNDTTVCGGLTLDAGNPGASFAWGCDAIPAFTQTLSVGISGEYCVTVTNAFGCQDSDAVVVTVNQAPQVNLGNDIQTCTPATLSQVTPIPNSTCLWTLPGGGTDNNCTITAAAAGTYSLAVTDGNGCTGSDNIVVTFQTPPTVNIGGGATDTVCNSKVLNAGNAGATYQWTTPGGNASSQSVTAATTGKYKVVVTNSIGCKGTDSANIVINTAPATPNITIGYTGAPFEYTFTAATGTGMGNTYTWTFTPSGGGAPITVTGNPVIRLFPEAIDFYEIKVTVTNDCGTADDTESLLVNGVAEGLDAAISVYPNPTDGVAYVNIKGLSQEVRMTVYDANGRILMSRQVSVFEQRDALKLDLSEFAKGTYLMRFDTEAGTATRKVTLQ